MGGKGWQLGVVRVCNHVYHLSAVANQFFHPVGLHEFEYAASAVVPTYKSTSTEPMRALMSMSHIMTVRQAGTFIPSGGM